MKIDKKKKNQIKSFLYVTLGVAISSFAFSFFLNPYSIVIGGVSGIGVIFKEMTGGYDPSYIMLGINIFLLLISLFLISKEFFIKTVYGALAFPVFVWIFNKIYTVLLNYIPSIRPDDPDMMLIILFSSIIMGYGLGLAVKYGGSTGGTEIPQKIMYEKMHLPYSLSLYIIDGTVVILGFFLLKQDISFILYEIVFIILSGYVMDTVVFSGFNKRCVNIISNKCNEIRDVLLNDFSRGVTSIKVVGEFSQNEKKMIVCLLSTIEYYKLRKIIEEIDPQAFFYCTRASEVRGEGFTYESKD